MSRPTTFNEPTVQTLEQAFRDGFSVIEACRTSGVSRAAYYLHLGEDEAFMDRMRIAQDYITIKAKHVIVEKIIREKDVSSARWWLQHRAKDEFGAHALSTTEIDEREQLSLAYDADPHDDLSESMKLLKEAMDALIDKTEKDQRDPARTSLASQPTVGAIPSNLGDKNPVKTLKIATGQHDVSLPSPAYSAQFDIMADLYG